MKYNGKLYGKVGHLTFDTGKTSEDWDRLEENSRFLKFILSKIDKDSPEEIIKILQLKKEKILNDSTGT